MTNQHSTLTGLFTDIASAIREKDGSTAPIIADAFPSAIRAIPSGGGGDHDAEDGIIMKTISGEYVNNRVTTIGDYVFYSCSNLTTASFPACTTIGARAFSACSKLTTASFQVCTTIGSSAFYECTNLTTASFPACTTIKSGGLRYCTNLTTTFFPVCTTIESYAFTDCSNLTTASFPACTMIGSFAFDGCSKLTTASFPACTTMNNNAFRDCYRLLSLYLYNSSLCALLNSNAFYSTPIAGFTYRTSGVYGSIFVPMSLLSAYQTSTNWTYFSSRFVGVNPEDM